MNRRKIGPVRACLYRLSDRIAWLSRRNYAAWCAFGSMLFGLCVSLLIPPVPMVLVVACTLATGWLSGWLSWEERR